MEYHKLIGKKFTFLEAKELLKQSEFYGYSLLFSDDLVLQQATELVHIDEYENRHEEIEYGVYSSVTFNLIEDGFETEEDAETWASENGYELE